MLLICVKKIVWSGRFDVLLGLVSRALFQLSDANSTQTIGEIMECSCVAYAWLAMKQAFWGMENDPL